MLSTVAEIIRDLLIFVVVIAALLITLVVAPWSAEDIGAGYVAKDGTGQNNRASVSVVHSDVICRLFGLLRIGTSKQRTRILILAATR
jgi:hypothetical protein